MNTVCLPTDKIPSECPIVDIQLLTDTVGFENYTKTDYADLIMAFSKDEKDQSPITSTRVGPFACLNPEEYDNGAYALSSVEKDSKKADCSKVDEGFV